MLSSHSAPSLEHLCTDRRYWNAQNPASNHLPQNFPDLAGRSQINEVYVFILPLATQDVLYPYGPGQRDLETPKMDDGSSPEIPLLIPFIFFNVPYRSIYVSLH